ncbi:hypothetical protein SSCG_01753 [Streptomyces clavuligerus]|nr:hypothetical protein SSCG_01753 [Streptomyces clavuligerus]
MRRSARWSLSGPGSSRPLAVRCAASPPGLAGKVVAVRFERDTRTLYLRPCSDAYRTQLDLDQRQIMAKILTHADRKRGRHQPWSARSRRWVAPTHVCRAVTENADGAEVLFVGPTVHP